jgi:hypothetical protein
MNIAVVYSPESKYDPALCVASSSLKISRGSSDWIVCSLVGQVVYLWKSLQKS